MFFKRGAKVRHISELDLGQRLRRVEDLINLIFHTCELFLDLGHGAIDLRVCSVDDCQQSLPILRECFIHLGDYFIQALQVVCLFALQARRAPIASFESSCDLMTGQVDQQLGLSNKRAGLALDLVSLQQVLLVQLFHIVATECV